MAATHRPCRTLPAETDYADPPLPVRTYQEAADILGISWTAVQQGERRALGKLAADPVMQRLSIEAACSARFEHGETP